MIQIKTLFGKWIEVTKEQAKKYISMRLYNIACKHKKDTINYINENILKGIKFEELFLKEELSPVVLNLIYNNEESDK